MFKPIRPAIIRSFLRKEFKQLFRDRKMKFLLFGPPVIMMIIFGYSVNLDVTGVDMAVMDRDRTPMSRSLAERFTASGYFTQRYFIDSPREIDDLLDSGRAEFVLIVERGFSSRVRSGLTGDIQTIIDGADSNRAAVIVSYVNQITSEFSREFLEGRIRTVMLNKGATASGKGGEIGLRERTLFNPDLASRNFFLPG
jgi:ABC-2 type transport system permease protein